MAKFIAFINAEGGGPIYVNPELVQYVRHLEDDLDGARTAIGFQRGQPSEVWVRGPIATTMLKLEGKG